MTTSLLTDFSGAGAACHIGTGGTPTLGPTSPTALDSGSLQEKHVKFKLECEREDDGRWLAEVSQLPGVLAYGASANEAMAKAEVLALRVLAEQLEHGEVLPLEISISLPAAA
jgi:predicted RNase H-like HicB family nuclease